MNKQNHFYWDIWNVQSAVVLQKLQYKAIATSSMAVAETLGYQDGEQMPFDEYLLIIKRIKASTSIPLSVDLEAGYGETEDKIVKNIQLLHELGIAGINIEDSVVNASGRIILNANDFAQKLAGITTRLKALDVDIFINVRCDTFLLDLLNACDEAVNRIKLYEKVGANGIFLPCITAIDDIKTTVSSTKLPVNVMCMPGLPDFEVLQSLGVKRISMGSFLNNAAYKKAEALAQNILRERNFSGLF
ncbi:MAG: isocitrate lyase/phosphoenolpyruvate mutase family protein [Mucilaginibacter sp.]|uniref:isocitrate lyase/PEP mutase family protein n=1 Tax=Mucilaginibacter sp. TaxID=1882438 RepID=UPI0031A7E09A